MNVTIPNNPMQAFLLGKRQGTKDNMDMVAMCLLDKCGFHTRSEDVTDTHSIEFLFAQLRSYTAEINAGRLARRDVAQMLADEEKLQFNV